jgi:hypothetical protein
MKFYEHHYEDYIHSLDTYNIHPELTSSILNLPSDIRHLCNIIVYGPSGVGKYTQTLHIIRKYSQSSLKYDKKIKIQTDKIAFTYRISDIHYEIDMSLLGCNPKILWNELFSQIVDIISVKQEKTGIIVCKNFHMIHNELLEIFYSYIQQYNHPMTQLNIKFIIITEHISFLPNNILNSSKIISLKRPSKESYQYLLNDTSHLQMTPYPINESLNDKEEYFSEMTRKFVSRLSVFGNTLPHNNNNNGNDNNMSIANKCNGDVLSLKNICPENILNLKEIKYFSLLKNETDVPIDLFDIICNKIIQDMESPQKISFTTFRDSIYDILVYNLDVAECIWFIFVHFVKKGALSNTSISKILNKTYTFLKYYNNNYRPIYHLESILFYIIIQINSYNEL